MADLLAILSQGASSLGAQRAAGATASHNIENVDTPGYSRQRANLSAELPADQQGPAFIGRGATLSSVSQARDRFLEAQLPATLSASAESTSESEALSAVSALDPDAAGGLNSALSGFFSAMRALAQNASDPGLRTAAVAATQSLATSFNTTAGSIQQAQAGLDQQTAGLVTQANSLAQQVAQLNGQIRAARATGAEPNDLLDARQSLQDQLSEMVGASPVPNGQGDAILVLPGGTTLVGEDRAAQLSAAPDPAHAGHLILLATLTDGSGPVAIASVGGTLGGAMAARDGALQTALSGLDNLAFDLAGAVNTVHSAGFALDGTTGRDLLDAGASASGAATRLSVNAAIAADPSLLQAASAAGAPGDGGNALALLSVENQPLSTGQAAAGALSQIVSDFGAAAQRVASMSDQESAIKDHLSQLRDSASGVSIDEEMVEMTQAQRAYEAVTKVIAATDDMLTNLMTIGSTT